MSDSSQNPPPQNPSEGAGYQPPAPPPLGNDQPMGAPMGQPGPGYAPMPGGVGQPADLLMRFLARLIDMVLLSVVNFVLIGIFIVGLLTGGSAELSPSTTQSFGASAIYAILTTVITLGYFVLLESKKGQTLGKMALKLQTQGPDGGPPSFEQALKRNAFLAIGLLGIIPVLGVIGSLATLVAYIMIAVTISSSPTKQGWHDKFGGGTRVVKIG